MRGISADSADAGMVASAVAPSTISKNSLRVLVIVTLIGHAVRPQPQWVMIGSSALATRMLTQNSLGPKAMTARRLGLFGVMVAKLEAGIATSARVPDG